MHIVLVTTILDSSELTQRFQLICYARLLAMTKYLKNVTLGLLRDPLQVTLFRLMVLPF